MAQTIQDVISIPATSVNDDVLSAKRLAQLGPYDAAIATVFATAEAAGMKMSIAVGPRTLMERSEIGSGNRIPIDPDDLVANGIEMFPSERLTITVENTTAGALDFFYRAVMFEAAMQ